MTDNEIIKVLEYSPLNDIGGCRKIDALNLINRQKTEIEILIRKKHTLTDELAELQAENESLKELWCCLSKETVESNLLQSRV